MSKAVVVLHLQHYMQDDFILHNRLQKPLGAGKKEKEDLKSEVLKMQLQRKHPR